MGAPMTAPGGPAKLLIIVGLGVLVLGLLTWLAQALPENLRPFRLPGDIRIERGGVRFYFPITTMILLSLLINAIIRIVGRCKG